ncbi:hypothetical protein J437_LFUL012110 [Ladona fulva]|uniref:Uncharacterized protein n=1 Tax=Ladona fulva TaxID=123851 RepID=A0A8K0KC64_LADFU|nr:hypothetical protein J437_LFUL012110 [Ladona fulva]
MRGTNDYVAKKWKLVKGGYSSQSRLIHNIVHYWSINCNSGSISTLWGELVSYSMESSLGRSYEAGYYSFYRCVTKGEYEKRNMAFNEFDVTLRTVENLPGISVVRNFPYDYMHLTCLGVTRQLLFLLMMPPFLICLQSKLLAQLSVKELSWCKATELRLLSCVQEPIFKKNIVSHDVYVHFFALTYFTRRFVSEKYSLHRSVAQKHFFHS